MQTRRSLLGRAAKGAALASAWPTRSTLAHTSAAGQSLAAVKHVVIFSQENRSFDHYCGTISGVRGFADPHPLHQPNGASVFAQRDGQGQTVHPFRLNAATTSGQCVGDVAHDWHTGLAASNNGRMNQWVPHKGQNAMSYYARPDIPYFYGLADAFTLCDAYFCSFNGPTNPNRLFMMTGMIDPHGLYEGPVTTNAEPGFTWTTYPERLQKAGVSWRVYQETDNYDDNALAWFKQFRDADEGSPLYQNGMQRFPRSQFASDVRNNTLPSVSWVISPTALSEHPEHSPNKGMHHGATHYLNALAANPEVWAQTVFIWTYDENGGFFDHVAPPTPPLGTPGEFANGHAFGLGARVPTLVMSPWSRGGAVCSEVFDHTSLLRFLEVWTGVREPNISAWRRKICGDLTSALDFRSVSVAFPALPDSQAPAASADINSRSKPRAAPNGEMAPPLQEAGTRVLRPLPYQLSASLRTDLGTGQLQLALKNEGGAACSVRLQQSGSHAPNPLHITIGAKQEQTQLVSMQGYLAFDLELHGPNGFFRRWVGNGVSVAPGIEERFDIERATVELRVSNPTNAELSLRIATSIESLKGSEQVVHVSCGHSVGITLQTCDLWYDYRIEDASGSQCSWQLGGHIEGSDSRTLNMGPPRRLDELQASL
jgi:phospholipase C